MLERENCQDSMTVEMGLVRETQGRQLGPGWATSGPNLLHLREYRTECEDDLKRKGVDNEANLGHIDFDVPGELLSQICVDSAYNHNSSIHLTNSYSMLNLTMLCASFSG